MFSVSDLSEALAKLMPGESVSDATIQERFEWARRGGESYTYAFDVLGAGQARSYLLKALVPTVGTQTVQAATGLYLQHHEYVRASGVQVPNVYAVLNGTLLIDYIPDVAVEQLRSLKRVDQLQYELLVGQVRSIIERIYALGFRPIFGWSDFRVDHGSVYLVDLGVDLGSQNGEAGKFDSHECERALRYLLISV
ncbi:hypothetical protein ACWEF6_10660 [Amycolatopsis sp. NPDC004772]